MIRGKEPFNRNKILYGSCQPVWVSGVRNHVAPETNDLGWVELMWYSEISKYELVICVKTTRPAVKPSLECNGFQCQ